MADFMSGCVKHSCVSWTVFTILDAANDPGAAQMQKPSKQTKKPQFINKIPLARAIGQPRASTATSKRNRKQSVEPAGK